jgi:5-methylcytosine-specific restriction enzyme subunit McrC
VWRKGLLEMLRIGFGLRLDPLPPASQATSRTSLLELIARAYIFALAPILREGLAKGYRTVEGNGSVYRGRLRVADHLRENVSRADRFFVQYQTFDQDIPVNHVLATALHVLSWCALPDDLATTVEHLLPQFPDASLVAGSTARIDRVRLNRSTQRYSDALRYARLIIHARGPQLRTGGEPIFALLFDMNTLWERYIAALARRAAPAGMTVHTQERHDFWIRDDREVRRVRPDIVVRRSGGTRSGTTLLALDTKWKVATTRAPADEDLKQMFVYNEVLRGGRAVLLYPLTTSLSALRGRFSGKEHRCDQVHVGVLEQDNWSSAAIQRQLSGLLSSLLED